MSSIKVTEDIGYFAGYLRLHEEFDKVRELYDAFGRLRIVYGDEGDPGGLGKLAPLEDPDLGLSGRVRAPDIPVLPQAESPEVAAAKQKPQPALPQPADVELKDLSNVLPPVGFGGGGGGLDEPEFSVAYFEGGDDKIIEIEQSNFLNDSDFVGYDDLGEPIPHAINIAETLDGMLEAAEAEAAEALLVPDDGAAAIVDFVRVRDAEKAEEQPAEPAIGHGTYVNGELVDQPPELPTPEDEPETVPGVQGHLNPGLEAELGGNSATNAALVVDYNEATTSMVVFGDYFASNAIVQTNILRDNDLVELVGESAETELNTESTEPLNIASFVTTEVNFDGWEHSWTWKVEFVDGDLYDVKTLEHTNVMFDNDVILQTASSSRSTIVAGENDQYNVADIFDFDTYDLIVVTGDYHSANWIFQTNILLDDDIVKVVGGEDTASSAVSTGKNELINEATIEHIGSLDFKPLSENKGIDDFVKGIGAKNIDPAFAVDMDANGRVFDVLYVKGSYYDINVIKQLNVLADVDTAVQYLPGHESEDSSDAKQPWHNKPAFEHDVSTGGNSIKNVAKIVDVGTFANPYLGGDFYEETILVQVNIIEDEDHKNVSPNGEKIFHGDTKTLVSEVIAFTGPESDHVPEDNQPVKACHGHHDDMLGSVLS